MHLKKQPPQKTVSYDLNGIWRDGDFPVQIVQTGPTIASRWLKVPYLCDPGDGHLTNPTDVDFDGTLSGDTLIGQATTCSTGGLTTAKMTLQVIEDGDILKGSWFNNVTGRDEPMTVVRCKRYLEEQDRQRWFRTLGKTIADMASWKWPASFYLADFMKVQDETWITKSGDFDQVSSTSLQAGDVVIFRGNSPAKRPGQTAIAHSAIATGNYDEVSQLWWSRDVRKSMHDGGKVRNPPETQPGPQSGGYAITRDTISDLQEEFTDNQGQTYFFDRYEVWRPKKVSEPAKHDLCLSCPSQHIVKAPVQRGGGLRP